MAKWLSAQDERSLRCFADWTSHNSKKKKFPPFFFQIRDRRFLRKFEDRNLVTKNIYLALLYYQSRVSLWTRAVGSEVPKGNKVPGIRVSFYLLPTSFDHFTAMGATPCNRWYHFRLPFWSLGTPVVNFDPEIIVRCLSMTILTRILWEPHIFTDKGVLT
jgi:hypothetical protein